MQAGEDPFSQMKKDKAGRMKAGKKLELANVKNALKKAGRGAVPPTLKLAASLPEHGRGRPTKQMELKEDVIILSLSPNYLGDVGVPYETKDSSL
jgi:regulator of ribosome biosynthesis